MPFEFGLPWTVPDLSTAGAMPPFNNTDTATAGPNMNVATGPPAAAPPPAPGSRVGRPDRGRRAKVKASRRARRCTR